MSVDPPLEGTWPAPPPPRLRLILSALGTGVIAALVVPDAGFGVNLLLVALLIAASVLVSVRRRYGSEQTRPSPFSVGLTVISLALSAVAVIRSSEWLVFGCVLASAALGACVALGARRWDSVLASGLLMVESSIRSLPWVGSTMLRRRPRRLPFEAPVSVLTGAVVGTVCAVVVGALLASADATFANVLGKVGGWLVLDVPRVDVLVARVLTLTVVVLTVLALGFAASSTLFQPPPKPAERHPAEWLVPLILVAGTIAVFLAVDAAELFAADRASGTHAERAREGFGQLAVVTGLVLLLIAWAGRSAAERHRKHLALAGGTLLALTLLLAFSALRRLGLYMAEYGWTVTRFNAGAFELWLVGLLVIVGLAWWARRTDLLPRLVAGSAGLGLLVVALAGPDAVVASANVHRYQETGRIDSAYLSRLSPDAVPALRRLPAALQACAMPADNHEYPWYAWNLSRARAGDIPRVKPFCAGE